MQGSSFWKTVAIVGVIGIGSLAILEVQNQLGKQNLGETGPSSEELATLVAGAGGVGETTVTPDVGLSEFDKMMASAESSGSQLFSGSEPPLNEPADTFDAAFVNSDPVAAQPYTPPVNTNVTAGRLEQGGNPFAAQADVQAVAANYSGNSLQAVEPVGFVSDETVAGDSGSVQPFRRDGVQNPADKSDDSVFALFPSEDPTAAQQPEMSVAQNEAPAAIPPQTDSMKFFNGNEAAATPQQPQATAQFYESESAAPLRAAPLRPTPFFGDEPTETDNPPAGNTGPSLEPSLDAPPIAFPEYPNTNEARPGTQIQPASQDNSITNPFNEDLPGPQESVPQPRDIQPQPRDPQTPSIEFAPDSRFDAPADQEPIPRPDVNLPFAEDGDDSQPLNPFPVPALDEPGRTRIPDNDPSLISDPFPETDLPPDTRPAGDLFRNDFDANPNSRLSIPNRTQPSQPEFNSSPRSNDGSREFTSEPRLDERFRDPAPTPRFDSIPRLDDETRFDAQPRFEDQPREIETTPRRNDFSTIPEFDNQPRNFDSKPPMRDTRPADNGVSDRSRSGGVRTVSGVMSPNLVLEKTAPENATVGVPLDYKIFVRNEGDATAYDVVVEDEVPAGAKIEGARPRPELDKATNRLVWKFDQLQPNETEEIAVRLLPTGEGTLDGVATVKFKSRVRATTVITAPKLRIEMKGPDEVKLGDEVAYRYVITNEGSGEARDVFVRTLLPAEGGLKHPQGRDLEYEIGSMMPGQQREIVLAVVAAEAGEYRAEVVVSGAGGAKDAAAWRTNIIGSQLQIVRRGPKRRFVGRPAEYENIVSNETNFDAVDARVVEVIPRGMDFKSANKGGEYNPQTRSVTWQINRLGPGRQEQLQIELIPTNAGQLESAVTIYENAGLQGENYVSTTVVEDLHNVGAQMSQLSGPVEVGETFGFTITIDNRGTAEATDVNLVVDVPRQIKVVGAGNRTVKAQLVGDQVQYDVIVRIEPDERQTFELKLQGTEPVRNGIVSAKIRYRQMEQPLVVTESVTVYRDDF